MEQPRASGDTIMKATLDKPADCPKVETEPTRPTCLT
jgi:hypothetical protein